MSIEDSASPLPSPEEEGEALTVGDDDAGARVDVFLVRRVEHMSRAKARALTAEGKIRVNGRRVKKGHRVSPGETVRLEQLPAPSDFEPLANEGVELTIVHEDAHFVVVDKAAGIPCHPLRPHETDTVVNGLVARYPEMRGIGHALREAGLLHRLDNDTSGLLMAARTTQAFGHFADELTERRVDKRYVAVCQGFVHAPAFIDWPIAHDKADRRRMVVCERPEEADRMGARPASTEVLGARLVGSGAFSEVEVRAKSARRHQVRAHLAALGHPLAGDELYGGPAVSGLTRHFLHASRIAIEGLDGNRLDLTSPLGADLQAALAQLG